MKITRKQIIALSCALFLQLALFASLVHATTHQFHVQGELCTSFINFGQQDLSIDNTIPAIEFKSLSVETFTESGQAVHLSFRPVYASRAPPAS